MHIQHSQYSQPPEPGLFARRSMRLAMVSLVALAAACNKGADVIVNLLDPLTMPGQVTYAATAGTLSVSGTVTGLVPGSSITLTNKGADALTLTGNGAFSFPRLLVDGASYDVTISAQPSTLRCIVQNGSGTLSGAGVTNVVVTCPMAYKASRVWMRCTHGQQWNADAGDCTGTGTAGNNYGATGVRYCSTGAGNDCNTSGAGAAAPDSGWVTGQLHAPPYTNGATSSLYAACAALNAANSGVGTYDRTTWRVPHKDELTPLISCSDPATSAWLGAGNILHDNTGSAADPYQCGWDGGSATTYGASFTAPTIDTALFPNMPTTTSPWYWTSAKTTWPGEAWYVVFNYGTTSGMAQDTLSTIYVRCVSP